MLLADLHVDNIYLITGYTDMRKSVPGLVAIIVQQYQMSPDERSAFLFCGKRADRMKIILWENDGFLLLYKLPTGFRYQWPRNPQEAKKLTRAQYLRLLEGLLIDPRNSQLPKDLV